MDMKNLIPWARDRVPATRSEERNPLFTLHRQMNRLFDDVLSDFDLEAGSSLRWPSVEIDEDEKQVRVVAELPGLEEKDIDLSFRDGILTLSGEKKSETKTASYSERWQGRFSRSIDLGPDVDPDKVNAKFKNGVLTVTLEKRPEAQSTTRKIAIKQEA